MDAPPSADDEHPRIGVGVCVHAAPSLVRVDGARAEVLGGEIVRIATWALGRNLEGVLATAEATAGLTDLTGRARVGRYTRLRG